MERNERHYIKDIKQTLQNISQSDRARYMILVKGLHNLKTEYKDLYNYAQSNTEFITQRLNNLTALTKLTTLQLKLLKQKVNSDEKNTTIKLNF